MHTQSDLPLDHAHELAAAARDGNNTRIEELLKSGVCCDATHDLEDPQGAGRSAVFWAACGGHFAAFCLLKERGANLLTADNNGVSPFMAACGWGGSIEIAQDLKAAGVDPRATSNMGSNALHILAPMREILHL